MNHQPLPDDALEGAQLPEPFDGLIDALLVDHEISPSQARNLELEVGCPVMGRTMVILEIARLGYMAPRLREAARVGAISLRNHTHDSSVNLNSLSLCCAARVWFLGGTRPKSTARSATNCSLLTVVSLFY